jgi:hypothetical protein
MCLTHPQLCSSSRNKWYFPPNKYRFESSRVFIKVGILRFRYWIVQRHSFCSSNCRKCILPILLPTITVAWRIGFLNILRNVTLVNILEDSPTNYFILGYLANHTFSTIGRTKAVTLEVFWLQQLVLKSLVLYLEEV